MGEMDQGAIFDTFLWFFFSRVFTFSFPSYLSFLELLFPLFSPSLPLPRSLLDERITKA
jgi:hypothetical protein